MAIVPKKNPNSEVGSLLGHFWVPLAMSVGTNQFALAQGVCCYGDKLINPQNTTK